MNKIAQSFLKKAKSKILERIRLGLPLTMRGHSRKGYTRTRIGKRLR